MSTQNVMTVNKKVPSRCPGLLVAALSSGQLAPPKPAVSILRGLCAALFTVPRTVPFLFPRQCCQTLPRSAHTPDLRALFLAMTLTMVPGNTEAIGEGCFLWPAFPHPLLRGHCDVSPCGSSPTRSLFTSQSIPHLISSPATSLSLCRIFHLSPLVLSQLPELRSPPFQGNPS